MVTPTQAEIQAATAIQRIYRGGATREALRTGRMKSRVRALRRSAVASTRRLPANVTREILKKSIPRVPRSFNKRHAPKPSLSPGMRQWLRLAHTNAFNFPEGNYEQYINRVYNLGEGNRSNKIKAILARYELLQPIPNYPDAAVSRSPRVNAWKRRLETNFKRKYVPRRQNRLSSHELYAFLKTMSLPYLTRAVINAPRYA